MGSFPDEFWFPNRAEGLMRIGNAVPPLFMAAIAKHIDEHILHPARALDQAGAINPHEQSGTPMNIDQSISNETKSKEEDNDRR